MKNIDSTLSYIIRISLGTDVIRHIRLSGEDTLSDLSDYILQAFDFEDHHLHAFFMDNQAWSDADSYYSQTGDETGRTTNNYQLQQLHLEKGKKFLYLFDFGDAWTFACEILDILEEPTPDPLLIYEEGEAPEQYADYDAPDFIEELLELPVPVPDQLYDAAFAFRNGKLWKKINGQIFALQSEEKLVYCNITEYALYLYPNAQAFQNFCRLASCQDELNMDAIIAQDCIMCSFHNKADIPEAVVRSVQHYGKKNQIRLRGANSFPLFFRDQPDCAPWVITNSQDYDLLYLALLACQEMAVNRKQHIHEMPEIPLLIHQQDRFSWSVCQLPEEQPEIFPSPFPDETMIHELNQLPTQSRLECELVYYSSPAQEKPEEAPCYPCFLIAADVQTKHFLSLNLFRSYHKQADDILKNFMQELLAYGKLPEIIAVRDERTHQLLSHFCDSCHISIEYIQQSALLDELKAEMMQDHSDPDEQIQAIIHEISGCSVEELQAMSSEVRKDMLHLAEMGVFPIELTEKLKQAWTA